MSEKTAKAVGERAGDAYADTGNARSEWQEKNGRPTATTSDTRDNVANRVLLAGREGSRGLSDQFLNPRFVSSDCRVWLGLYDRNCASRPPLSVNLTLAARSDGIGAGSSDRSTVVGAQHN
jgi:hypothetical protein